MAGEASAGPATARQLEWEARVGRLAGGAALVGVALPIAAQLYLQLAVAERPRDAAQSLAFADRHGAELVLAASARALGVLLLAAALAFLIRASRFRRPNGPRGALVVTAVGAVVLAGTTVAGVIGLLDVSSEFLGGPRTEPRAVEMLRGGQRSVLAQVDLGARIAFGLAIILAATSAMRAGLLSRFMGILGVVVGVLLGVTGLSQAFLFFFWSGAVALILLDRWPGGRGPAWESGEAIPWPTAAEQRAAAERARAGDAEAVPTPAPAEEDGEPERPRKRKRRR
jgi:hypothetical protein